VFGSIALAFAISLIPQIGVNLLGGILIIYLRVFFYDRVVAHLRPGRKLREPDLRHDERGPDRDSSLPASGWNQIDDRLRAISIAALIAVAVRMAATRRRT